MNVPPSFAGISPLVFDPRDPLAIARRYTELECTNQGLCTVWHWRGDFFVWEANCYRSIDEDELKSRLYRWLASAKEPRGDFAIPFRPNRQRVADMMSALAAVANLPAHREAPLWLPGSRRRGCGEDVLIVANGILDLGSLEVTPATPALFSLNALPVAYDMNASAPEWVGFLQSVWPNDPEAIQALQEIFGYLLLADTRQEKIFLMVGPKRSGKGTIARVLTRLLGQGNVCGPTLNSLSRDFGLEPLIGKQAAIISDARLSGRTDQSIIAERLLSISGEDGLTVDRKYKSAWSGRLPTRFVILSNELPRLSDASGALVSRFVVLQMATSFFGREDHGLTDRITKELPGILNWALDGLASLRERGFFVQPSSALDAFEEMEALGSPVAAFVKERCMVEPGRSELSIALFEAWKDWCALNGRSHPGNSGSFGKDLRAAVPGVQRRQKGSGPDKHWIYEGVGLDR
jgi:putative DNA primase/helicase